MIIKYIQKKIRTYYSHGLFLLVIFTIFSLFLAKIYYNHAVGTSFVDEFNNIIAGYFTLNHRELYRDIFFNHQMLIVNISYVIQKVFHPESLYKLILYHRIFIICYSFIMGFLIVWRFRLIGLGFVFIYELTKFYLFGNLFLAEGIILYPLVYLAGLSWFALQNKKILPGDIVISAVFAWFIIFMREPYIPIALILYILILFKSTNKKTNFFSFFCFSLLSIICLFSVSLNNYFNQVVQFNALYVIPHETSENGSKETIFLKNVFYPIYILWNGKESFFRDIIIALDIFFLLFLSFLFVKYKQKVLAIFIFIALAASNTRFILPGIQFYGGYRILPWYGLFLLFIFLLLSKLFTYEKKTAVIFTFLFLGIVSIMLLSPTSYLWQKNDRVEEFTTNYGRYYTNGTAIKFLATKKDTLFIDGWDSLIFWAAGIESSYKYAFYYPGMKDSPLFEKEKRDMFNNNSPDFLYSNDFCKIDTKTLMRRYSYLADYIRFKKSDQQLRPACLFMKKTKLSQITAKQLEKIKQLGFAL